MARLRHGRRDRRRGGLGGPLAHLPPAGARGPALGRAAVGDARRTTPSRSSSTPAAHSARAPIRRRSSVSSCSRSSSPARCSTSAAAPACSRSPPRCSATHRCWPSTSRRRRSSRRSRTPNETASSSTQAWSTGDEPLPEARSAVANISIGAVLALPGPAGRRHPGAGHLRLLPLGAARPARLHPRRPPHVRRLGRGSAPPHLNVRSRRGDVPRRLPGLQGLARRRARRARDAAARRPRRTRRRGGRGGDQHLLRHERGAGEVPQGGGARGTHARPGLRDRLRREPRRLRVRRAPGERRRRRQAQRGDARLRRR